MIRKLIGLGLLLVGSIGIGAIAGQIFFNVMLKWLNPALLSQLSVAAIKVSFIGTGVVIGIAIFVWAFLAAFLARFFTGGKAGAKAQSPMSTRT